MASFGEQNSVDDRVADAAPDNWVDANAPAAARPFLRLMRADRPIGAWLLAIPGFQAIALAGGWADWSARDGQLATFGWGAMIWLFFAFAFGAVVMRGAGCVLNDLVDEDIDAKVERTRSRPLPSGAVSRREAVILLVVLCSIGLFILSTFNTVAIFVGLASVIPIGVYPIMKRIIWWPQAVLGVAFSWGALLGSLLVFSLPALLYLRSSRGRAAGRRVGCGGGEASPPYRDFT